MTYRVIQWRLLLFCVSVGLFGSIVARAVLALFGRRTDIADFAAGVGLYTVVFGVTLFLIYRPRRAWLRTSDEGLEFAATMYAPMLVPWPAVHSLDRTGSGPFTQLVVTPADPAAVRLSPGRRQKPRPFRGHPAYRVDVGMMTSQLDDLFTEVRRHHTQHRP